LAADWPNPLGTICAFLYLGKAYPLVRGPDDKGWRRAQPVAVTPHRFGRLVFDLEPLADGEGPLHLVVAIEFPGRCDCPGASGVGAGESAILTLVLKGKFDMCRIRI